MYLQTNFQMAFFVPFVNLKRILKCFQTYFQMYFQTIYQIVFQMAFQTYFQINFQTNFLNGFSNGLSNLLNWHPAEQGQGQHQRHCQQHEPKANLVPGGQPEREGRRAALDLEAGSRSKPLNELGHIPHEAPRWLLPSPLTVDVVQCDRNFEGNL